MNKLLMIAPAALLFAAIPAGADDVESRTTVEQHSESSGPGLESERSRSVETRTQHEDDDDESTTSVRRDERVSTSGGTMKRTTEKHVEHEED